MENAENDEPLGYPDVISWDAGCDYYRATIRRDQYEQFPKLEECRAWVEEMTGSIALDSGKVTNSNILGYNCYSKNGVVMGLHHEHGVLLQLSGRAAYLLWRAIPAQAKATRIDLQLTALFNRAEPLLALSEFYASRKDAQGRAKSTNRRVVIDGRGGSTLYYGSRQSPRFGRLYDKGAQSKSEPEGMLWRYEIELKEGIAQAIPAQRELIMGDHVSTASHVVSHFKRWGCWVPPFIEPGLWIPSALTVNQFDLTRRLKWLATQVAPTVQLVENSVSRAGLALGILGLKHPTLKHE